MSNIHTAFENGKAFIGFVTGGDGGIEKSGEFIMEMIRAGADLVEIGIPFSDPIAEGPVIQAANIRSLSAGTTIDKIFGLTKRIRQKTETPLVFLTYLNPVFHYGYGAFFTRCRESGVDGVIIPDLPFEEQTEVRDVSSVYGVDLISLIAPTSDDRIREIARTATGFLYVVSSMGVTGVRGRLGTNLASVIDSVRAAAAVPIAVGFGIHTPQQATEVARLADGVIVGSGIVKIIEEHGEDAGPHIYAYVRKMKDAITG
jgi:tryptophan synthase alpha chain